MAVGHRQSQSLDWSVGGTRLESRGDGMRMEDGLKQRRDYLNHGEFSGRDAD